MNENENTPRTLDELLAVLQLSEKGYGDRTSLPTFGGEEPYDTSGVWSWDETRLLVGRGGVDEWKIIPREEEE